MNQRGRMGLGHCFQIVWEDGKCLAGHMCDSR